MNIEKELSQYDLNMKQSDALDRVAIDFSFRDKDGMWVVTVWGDSPKDIEVECDHPYQCIDWGDDGEMGECMLCGSQCSWKWEDDGDGGKERNIYQWHKMERIGGLIGKYLKELGR